MQDITSVNEQEKSEQRLIVLTPQERAPIDEIQAEIDGLMQRKTGMLAYVIRFKGINNAAVEYKDGTLIVTPNNL